MKSILKRNFISTNIVINTQNLIKKEKNQEIHTKKTKNTKNSTLHKQKKIKRLDTCTLTYIHSISDQKKRFLKGKCKKINYNKQGTMFHIVSKYFNTLLIMRYPINSPKYINE